MSNYGTIIIGNNNGLPPIVITQKMLDASIPLITFLPGSVETALE